MLNISGLHLWRGERHVLRNVQLTAKPGQCVLLTGRNGAGKTTLLRAIAGLLEPEEGQITWRGAPARQTRDQFHSELAYLGHEPPLKGDLTGRENLRFSTGLRRPVTAVEIDAALTRTGARDFAERPVQPGNTRRRQTFNVSVSCWLISRSNEPSSFRRGGCGGRLQCAPF